MTPEVRIEHRYPAALVFLRRQGPDAVAVLHDLLAHAERRGGDLVVQASVRQVSERLGFASKDTVHRRLRQLMAAGVLQRLIVAQAVSAFEAPTYRVNLDGTGISLTTTCRTASSPDAPAHAPTA